VKLLNDLIQKYADDHDFMDEKEKQSTPGIGRRTKYLEDLKMQRREYRTQLTKLLQEDGESREIAELVWSLVQPNGMPKTEH
jgi:tRNA pseudouridine-54 N-methylase